MTPRRSGIEEATELERVFAALGHATRRQILMVLGARGGVVSAGQIAERFSCSWPTVTRHLGVLEEAGLVSVRRQGRERHYALERERLQRVVGGWLGHF